MIGWYGGHMYSALKCSQEGSASDPGPSSSPALSSVTRGGEREERLQATCNRLTFIHEEKQ